MRALSMELAQLEVRAARTETEAVESLRAELEVERLRRTEALRRAHLAEAAVEAERGLRAGADAEVERLLRQLAVLRDQSERLLALSEQGRPRSPVRATADAVVVAAPTTRDACCGPDGPGARALVETDLNVPAMKSPVDLSRLWHVLETPALRTPRPMTHRRAAAPPPSVPVPRGSGRLLNPPWVD